MSKKIISILFLLLTLFSCSKEVSSVKESDGNEVTDQGKTAEQTEMAAETTVLTEAVNVRNELSFFKEPGKGSLGTLYVGEVVSYTGNTTTDSKNVEWVEIVTSNGITGWTYSYYMFENFKTGVIKPTSEIILFDKANDNSVSDTEIAPFHIIAFKKDSKEPMFSEIGLYTGNNKVIHNKFALSDEISTVPDDILFAKVMRKYLSESDFGLRAELIDTLKSLNNACQEYKNYLNKIISNIDNPQLQNAEEIYDEYKEFFTIFDNYGALNLEKSSLDLKGMDIDYRLLKYIVIDSIYTDEGLAISLFNTANKSLTTIPAEIELILNEDVYYIGVVGNLSILPGEMNTVILNGQFPITEGKYSIKLNFVNNVSISGREIDFGGEE